MSYGDGNYEYIPPAEDYSGGYTGVDAWTPPAQDWTVDSYQGTPTGVMSNMGSYIPDNPGGEQVPYNVAGSGGGTDTASNWLQQMGTKFFGPGSFLGGTQGAFPNQEKNGWLQPIMSTLSGIYGMSLADKQRKMAMEASRRSSPWVSSGGIDAAGGQLKRVIAGDFAGDGGYDVAQQAAARASAGQPGGFAASAAATAALRYQNERIQALGGPAGVGFQPQYGTAIQGLQGANDQASRSLGSIGYGMTGNQIPPWLTQYLIQNGMPTR